MLTRCKNVLSLIPIFILLLPITLWPGPRPPDYFQQEVAYRIDVTLNDTNHTLSAYLELDYTQNRPYMTGTVGIPCRTCSWVSFTVNLVPSTCA